MAANLLDVGSKLLGKAMLEEDIQWPAEMTHPIHTHHPIQHDLSFRRIVREIVEAYLSNRIQGSQTGILDPRRGVRNVSPGRIS